MQLILDSEQIIELVNYYVKVNRPITEEDLNDFISLEEWATEEYEDNLVDLQIEKPNDLIPPELDTRFWNNDFINRIKRNN